MGAPLCTAVDLQYASTIPAPSSDRPKHLPLAFPKGDCDDRATPRQLKAEAMRLRELTGMHKRETAREYNRVVRTEDQRAWETVRGWLDPRALDRTPPPSFVRWLRVRVEIARLTLLEREACSR